jgi:enterochelin esterase family protein
MSPRLRRLQAALSQGTGQALAEFWQEVSAQGTPLIEPLADDQRRRLVTFLWRAVEETHAVTISSSLTGTLGGWPFNQHRFARLAGTDLWYRSYRVPSDTRTTYQLGPNDPLTASEDVEDWGARTAHFRADPLSTGTQQWS